MPFDIRPLLDPMYWLSIDTPNVTGTFGQVVFTVFALLFIAGAIVRIKGRKRAKDRHAKAVIKQAGALLMTWGGIGALLFFFSYEGIRFLGGRVWYAVLAIAMLVWAGFIYRFAKQKLPALRERDREHREKDKYLPKQKKK